MPRAVVFDLDGVLVDSEPLYERALRAYVGALGRDDDAELYALTLGRREVDFVPELAERLGVEAAKVRLGLGAATTPLLGELRPMPRAAETVSSLHGEGRRIAVATSSAATFARAALGRVGVGELIDALATGDEVERGKPDPEIYLLAAERLSLDPSICVAIEDTPAGIAAAKAAGMTCIAVAHALSPAAGLGGADAIVDDLKAAAAEIRRRG
jgi:beta-phosphoglucomutase-like phosphatase (HAD superfamily)